MRGIKRPLPAPPVPPRPSQALVAEAISRNLAKQSPPALEAATSYSSCPITFFLNKRRERMATLQGLPPLPKSLSGEPINHAPATSGEATSSEQPANRAPPARKPSGLDAQLGLLRQEMFGLRQLDLTLLGQLWSLNESIQEFRQLLADQDALSPPSPSSADDGDGEDYYRYLSAVPEQYCLSTSSSQSSIEYGNV